MDYSYWQKQTPDKPLFEDIIWNKPQNKKLAGKLLIIGGNNHGISAPGEAYKIASSQGAGECKVVLPDSTRKLLPNKLEGIEFTPSNPSGSFGKDSYNELKSFISWADASVFIGDFGNNSETAILLEKLATLPGLQTYANDAADYFVNNPLAILQREKTLLMLTMPQLQKYVIGAKVSQAFIHNLELLRMVEKLHEFTNIFKAYVVTQHKDQIFCASSGKVVTTKLAKEPEDWATKLATSASVWWMQSQSKPLQAIATATTTT